MKYSNKNDIPEKVSIGALGVKKKRKVSLPNELLYYAQSCLSVSSYAKSIGYDIYEWQRAVLNCRDNRIVINGARQSGKSTIISLKTSHKARFSPKSLSLVLSPTLDQAYLVMQKIKEFIAMDKTYPKLMVDNKQEIKLVNGSTIKAIASSEQNARGYSAPDLVIIDEASRVEDIVYTASVLPMFTKSKPDYQIILISTPFGKQGFFYNAFMNIKNTRFYVRSHYQMTDLHELVRLDISDKELMDSFKKKDIRAYFSPQHSKLKTLEDLTDEMSVQTARQEFEGEFVEPDDQVFTNDQIDMFLFGRQELIDISNNIDDFGEWNWEDNLDEFTKSL